MIAGVYMSKLLSKGSMTSGFITLPMKRIDPMRKQQKPFLKEIILLLFIFLSSKGRIKLIESDSDNVYNVK